jgi:hypothetical protein
LTDSGIAGVALVFSSAAYASEQTRMMNIAAIFMTGVSMGLTRKR